ncbi:MAG: DbpA RNA binding domain-containing protein [Alistipes sp.]
MRRECGLPDGKIGDLRVLESYSFVSVPFSEAREAIRRLNDIHRGGRPIARLAKESAPQKDFRHDRPAGNKGAGRNTGGRREVRPAGKTERAAARGGKEPSVESIEWDAISWGTAPSPKRKRLGRQERVRPASDLEEANEVDSRPGARRVTTGTGTDMKSPICQFFQPKV